jgi:hypothetical protein
MMKHGMGMDNKIDARIEFLWDSQSNHSKGETKKKKKVYEKRQSNS